MRQHGGACIYQSAVSCIFYVPHPQGQGQTARTVHTLTQAHTQGAGQDAGYWRQYTGDIIIILHR